MAWTGEGPQPDVSRDELLARVRRRGRELRLRRRAALGTAAVIALLSVGGPVALLAGGDGGGGGAEVASTGSTATTTGPATLSVAEPGPSVSTSSVVDDQVQPSAVAPSGPPSTRPPATTPPAATATTAPPVGQPPEAGAASTTTTVPTPVHARCGPGHVVVTAVPDKATFAPGETVKVSTTARNASPVACYFYSVNIRAEWKDPSGRVISGFASHGDNFQDTAMPAGHVTTFTVEWDQRICEGTVPCPQAPAGAYSVTVGYSYDGPPVEATAGFTLAG